MPEQLVLFSTDEDEELLLNQSPRYRGLSSESQALVQGYIKACRSKAGQPTKADWIKASGLSRSTAYEVTKRDAVEIYAAIREATQVACVDGAQYGAMALVMGGIRIYEALAKGTRSTQTLTNIELSIMRDCMALMGLMPQQQAAALASFVMTDPSGRRTEMSVGVGGTPASEPGSLNSMLDKLRARQRQTLAVAPEQGPAECVLDEAITVEKVG